MARPSHVPEAVHRNMRRKNPYADLGALLDTTRKLSDEEMAELQLELGYVRRALLIYERLLLGDPKNGFFRARCEWLARLVMRDDERRRLRPPRKRRRTPRGHAPAGGAKVEPGPSTVSTSVRPLSIITVGG